MPESARWLVVNKKFKTAEEVIRKIARINQIDLPEDLELDTIVDVCKQFLNNSCRVVLSAPEYGRCGNFP